MAGSVSMAASVSSINSFSSANISISSDPDTNLGKDTNLDKGVSESNKIPKPGAGIDLKLERIITKFRAGRELTAGELSYLSKKAPSIYQKAMRIIQRREQLEKRLRQARTKEEVQSIMMNEMQSVAAFCAKSDDDFEKESMVNQMIGAYNEVVKKDSYKEMPDSEIELQETMMSRPIARERPVSVKPGEEGTDLPVAENGDLDISTEADKMTDGNLDINNRAETGRIAKRALDRNSSAESNNIADSAVDNDVGDQGLVSIGLLSDGVTYTDQGMIKSQAETRKGRRFNIAL